MQHFYAMQSQIAIQTDAVTHGCVYIIDSLFWDSLNKQFPVVLCHRIFLQFSHPNIRVLLCCYVLYLTGHRSFSAVYVER